MHWLNHSYWLNDSYRLNHSDFRDRGQRGAVAVVVALLMVALVGAAAISIDVASLYSDRQQLQTGADAASLAIAQDCAQGNCGNYPATAQNFGSVNMNDHQSTATVVTPGLGYGTGHVTVRNATVTQHWFAPVLGYDSTSQTVQSTASWGPPSGGTALLPLSFSWCAFNAQTGGGLPSDSTPRVIKLSKFDQTACTGPSGNAIPGGFGWVTPDGNNCEATTSIGTWVTSDTGNDVPSPCTAAYFTSLQNQTVLLPIFDTATGTGTNGQYRILGYAAFKLTGYFLSPGSSGISWNAPCSSPDRCLSGYFVQFVTEDGWQTSPDAPQLGSNAVRLTD